MPHLTGDQYNQVVDSLTTYFRSRGIQHAGGITTTHLAEDMLATGRVVAYDYYQQFLAPMGIAPKKPEDLLQLPEECPVTVEHFNVHVQSAKKAWGCNDHYQVAHDLDIALRILVVLYRRTGTKLEIPAWEKDDATTNPDNAATTCDKYGL